MYHDPISGGVDDSASEESPRARWDLDSYRTSGEQPQGTSANAPLPETANQDKPPTVQTQQGKAPQSESANPRKPTRIIPAAILGAGAALLVAAVTVQAHLSRIDLSTLPSAFAAAATNDSDPRTAATDQHSSAAQIAQHPLDCDHSYTYTVVPGDTLSQIAHRAYRDGNRYMPIFSANRDRLREPDLVHAGEEIRIPCF